MPKKYDLAIPKSKYTNRDGEEKTEWMNIGVIMEKDDGGQYMLLDPFVNLAAVDRGVDNNGQPRSTVMVGMFKPKDTTKKESKTPEFEE